MKRALLMSGLEAPSASSRSTSSSRELRAGPAGAAWERRRDRKLGEEAASKREGKVVRSREKSEDHEPVMIVPAAPTPAKNPRA